MRNISLSDFESYCIKNLKDCEVFCFDRQILYACDKGVVIKIREDNEEVICRLTENLYPVSEIDDIPKALEITYCCEKELLYIILYNGDIISLDDNSLETETIVGSVDGGIKAAQWSPEQEVVALVTGNDSVIVMTNDFDMVSEVSLHGGGFGEKQFITVGWGKKETQFRGSEGKFTQRDGKKEMISVESNDVVKISWRGDAEYFAVSSLNPESSQRYLRIFSKNGILQYTSENLNGLEHCLDWRPSGNLIASTQRLPNKYNVCFFEKNGLKHGEFTLPLSYKEIEVKQVMWNKDSRILALFITKVAPESNSDSSDNTKYIQLYTVSNYHWYCKYTIHFSNGTTPLLMQWDHQKFNSLHVIVKRNDNSIFCNKYSWLWVTNKSKGNNLNDESFVAVIDGCNLQLTSFNRGIIPPPMCTYKIQVPVPINQVTFAPDDNSNVSSNDLLMHLCDGSIMVYKFLTSDGTGKLNHEFVGKINSLNGELNWFYNVHWVAFNKFILCHVKLDDMKSKPFLSVIEINNFDVIADRHLKEIPLQSSVVSIRASKSEVVIHQNDGKLYLFNESDDSLKFLHSVEKGVLLDFEVKDVNGTFFIFSLDTLNKFYINGKVVFNNVLSFHLHEKFVLLTNMKHELLCVNLDSDISNVNDFSQVYKRGIERGSRLVTSVHRNMKVILQMPRGNLECIQPRALTLFAVGKYLDSLNYYDAFDLMRKQRINLNLLYDHNPKSFCWNSFIDEIKDPQLLSLFISDLTDEDVTKTMYSVSYSGRVCESGDETKSKVDRVCELMEKALMSKPNPDEYLLPILTCYIKRGKVEFLEVVLSKLKDLKEKENSGIKSVVTFDEAFRYVLYLIDVEELYKIALGMYDFDLVLIVASKSQKDPKEYLPFLNDLKKLEPSYQKFTIDKYLKRYKKALTNLVLCDGDGIFSECINFIKAHNLYKFALTLIPQNTDRYKNVCTCYGEELMKSHLYEEAGIMYSTAGMYQNAVEAYRKSGNWREAIYCGRELKKSENELSEFYLEIAIDLTQSKQFGEAATVYLDYLKDVEECVKTLAEGKLFGEAYRISHLYGRTDLINSFLVPAILEQSNLLKMQMTNFSETFVKQKNRLEVVRKQKLEPSENKDEHDKENDLFSESSTVFTQTYAGSRTTNRTYRSAKNRRKQERKLLSLKEGSPYEDIALVTSLHGIVTNCMELKSEVRELNKFLIKIQRFEIAEKLQNELEQLLKIIEGSKSEIWTPDLVNIKQSYGPQSTSNEISEMFLKSENVTPVLLNPKFAICPETQNGIKWELEILKPQT